MRLGMVSASQPKRIWNDKAAPAQRTYLLFFVTNFILPGYKGRRGLLFRENVLNRKNVRAGLSLEGGGRKINHH